MAEIRLNGVTKVFDGGVVAVDDVTLEADHGEVVVLVGPSGCGKSTLLRMVAGLEDVTAGEIWIGDRDVTDLAPRDRDIAMVFQNYALYPHMTVAQNIGFGLKLRKESKTEAQAKIEEVAKLLALEELLERKPGQLSGGQRQRVAMGRAMVREPLAFLMDEPLSNLDAKLRVQMRAELNRLHSRLGTTTLYVTHDQIEAMTLGDKVAVLKDGVLQQFDSPKVLFQAPVNVFVASFMGSPAMNLMTASVEHTDAGLTLMIGDQPLPAPRDADLSQYVGSQVIAGIRPSDLSEGVGSGPSKPMIRIDVDVVEELGTEAHLLFRMAGEKPAEALLGAEESATVDSFTAIVDARTTLRAGDRTSLAIDLDSVHLFDPTTELAISRNGK
jgi:multiple sugar transport system ATP-binding protein